MLYMYLIIILSGFININNRRLFLYEITFYLLKYKIQDVIRKKKQC